MEDLVLEHGELTLFDAGETVCEQGQALSHYFMPISQPLKLIQSTQENADGRVRAISNVIAPWHSKNYYNMPPPLLVP